MKREKTIGTVMLLTAAMIWGMSFVAQTVGMDYVGPFLFNGLRSFLAAAALTGYCFVMDGVRKKRGEFIPDSPAQKKRFRKAGILCGLMLTVASSLQQYGLSMTTVGKASFITVLYMIVVPFASLLLGKKLPKHIWFSVVLALAGLYLLCVTESLALGKGDFFVLLGAFAYAGHILMVDHFAPEFDGAKLSCIQFWICGVLATGIAFFSEPFSFSGLASAALPLCYSGFLSGGLGFTLQIYGQKRTDPSIASLLMSFESVFALLGGMLILHQIPTLREAAGCVLMFAAILLIQVAQKKESVEELPVL
ncbi:MAG TPA: DMT family transporter [Oscillospiraceae bacterium]|nr:DMT family transporter [Oscillospiraceae bacterium]HRW56518.1 DMT family transporter [Oscillospiraceae bacterium]